MAEPVKHTQCQKAERPHRDGVGTDKSHVCEDEVGMGWVSFNVTEHEKHAGGKTRGQPTRCTQSYVLMQCILIPGQKPTESKESAINQKHRPMRHEGAIWRVHTPRVHEPESQGGWDSEDPWGRCGGSQVRTERIDSR
jgi:hypothetical protein